MMMHPENTTWLYINLARSGWYSDRRNLVLSCVAFMTKPVFVCLLCCYINWHHFLAYFCCCFNNVFSVGLLVTSRVVYTDFLILWSHHPVVKSVYFLCTFSSINLFSWSCLYFHFLHTIPIWIYFNNPVDYFQCMLIINT